MIIIIETVTEVVTGSWKTTPWGATYFLFFNTHYYDHYIKKHLMGMAHSMHEKWHEYRTVQKT